MFIYFGGLLMKQSIFNGRKSIAGLLITVVLVSLAATGFIFAVIDIAETMFRLAGY